MAARTSDVGPSERKNGGFEQAVRQHTQRSQQHFINIINGICSDDEIITRLPGLFEQPPDARPILTIADLKDEFEQFRVWASNIGVFASGHASLDYHLRQAFDVKEGIVRILISLSDDLVEVLSLLKADRQYDEQSERDDCISDDDSCSGSDFDSLDDIRITCYELQDRLEHISDTIDKLLQLSRVIRTSGIRSQNVKAARYLHYENGINQTDIFETHYLPTALQSRWQLQEPLFTRLCDAISRRRRRFMFNREHRRQLAAYNAVPAQALEAPHSILGLPFPREGDGIEEHTLTTSASTVTFDFRTDVPCLGHGANFAPDTDEVNSSPRTGSYSLQTETMSTDIPPAPQPLADWIEHHKWTHAMQWWCEGISGDHLPTKFLTAEEFSEHLRSLHTNQRTPHEVSRRFETSGAPSQEAFRHCPFCDFQTEPSTTSNEDNFLSLVRSQQLELQSHIFEHLLSAFVLALPDHKDVDDTVSDEELSQLLQSDFNAQRRDLSKRSFQISSEHASSSRSSPGPSIVHSAACEKRRSPSEPGAGIIRSDAEVYLLAWKAPQGRIFKCPSVGCGQGYTRLGQFSSHIDGVHPELSSTDLRHKLSLALEAFSDPELSLEKDSVWNTEKAIDYFLCRASADGQIGVMRMLLDTGANVNPSLSISASFSWWLEHGDRYERHSPLYMASENGHEEAVQVLLDAGAHVNARGNTRRRYQCGPTALCIASGRGHERVVQRLLSVGAKVNSRTELRDALKEALAGGHEKVVQVLLDAGAGPNTKTHGNEDPILYTASLRGQQEMVQMLLKAGAKVNAPSRSGKDNALVAASEHGYEKIVEMLLAAGANIWRTGGYNGKCTALYAASNSGHHDVVQVLLDAGANINALGGYNGDLSALETASARGHEKVVRILLDAGAAAVGEKSYENALRMASESGHASVVEMLLDARVDLRSQRLLSDALRMALKSGHDMVVKVLLNARSDPSAWFSFDDALRMASERGHGKVVHLLLNAGLTLSSRAMSCGTLQTASAHGHQDIVKMLLDAGADADGGQDDDDTALQAASRYGHREVVQLLLDAGADVKARGGRHGSALEAAREGKHYEIIQLLVRYEAAIDA